MIASPVTRPMTSGPIPAMGNASWPGPGHGCWPTPSPWFPGPCGPDAELERLRQLEREASREQEKEVIRERLRRMGVSEDRITGPKWPCPHPVFPPPMITGPSLSLEAIIRQAQRHR